ncbi:MAG: N-6 DNA methylase, partial [Planctomycetales bacterium]|nr:N-6 DNA methylase [Planctomycetales bacterium]
MNRLLKVNFAHLHEFMHSMADLPFETPSERRELLNVFDQVIAETGDPNDGQFATPVNIAHLIAALANPQPGERVYDPCFGSGNLLVAAWQMAERSPNELHRTSSLLDVAGIEIDPNAYLIGLVRMLLAGIETPRLEHGNSLERGALSNPNQQGFDLVLANPPIGFKINREAWRFQHFAIATSDSTGLFIQHAMSQLKLQGRAVIAVPEGFLFRGGAVRELRRHLVERGQVEAVIGLPSGSFAPYTGVKGSLLVLNKEGGASRVRMADASPLFETRAGRKGSVIRPEIAEQLAVELRRPELVKPTKGHEEATPDRGLISRFSWELSINELEAADWDLTPRRREKGGLDELLYSLKAALGDTGSVAALSSATRVFAGRLVKPSDLLDEPPSERAVGYVRTKDLSQGKVARVTKWLRSELTAEERRWALLPGDVLVSKSGTIGKAALVRNGVVGSIAANGLYVLRSDQERLDAGFLLAYLASPACQNWLAAQSRGTAIQHLSRNIIDSLPIALPPLQIQARVAANFREHGGDALSFLARLTGGTRKESLFNWLAALESKTRLLVGESRGDEVPALLQQLATLAIEPTTWGNALANNSSMELWLPKMIELLGMLHGLARMPPGPGYLSSLQQVRLMAAATLSTVSANNSIGTQVRTISEQLGVWAGSEARVLA